MGSAAPIKTYQRTYIMDFYSFFDWVVTTLIPPFIDMLYTAGVANFLLSSFVIIMVFRLIGAAASSAAAQSSRGNRSGGNRSGGNRRSGGNP